MKSFISNLSSSNAALVVGVAFIASIIMVTIVDDFLLSNFVIPGDTEALAKDIESNGKLFGFAVIGYLIVLVLDSIIALALYVVLRPSNKKLALLTAALRLLYVGSIVIGLIALVAHAADAYSYASIKLLECLANGKKE